MSVADLEGVLCMNCTLSTQFLLCPLHAVEHVVM